MQVLAKYRNISNWKLYFATAIIIRAVLLCLVITLSHNWHTIVIQSDDGSYFSPVDNYVNNNCYCYVPNLPFAGRMPGYSLVYLAFRILMPVHASVMCVVLFQFLLSCFSAYVLCLITLKLFNSARIAVVAFFLYCVSLFPAIFDLYITAESLSVSAFIFALYYLIKALEASKTQYKYLLVSGSFITWAIFLRPYIGIFIVFIGCFIIYKMYWIKKENLKNLIIALILFSLPFTICESAWVVRNYNATHRLILLEDDMELSYGKIYSAPWLAIDNLVFTWGEEASNFQNFTPGSYFRYPGDRGFKGFPAKIFNKVTTYNKDSLVHLKQMYIQYLASKDTDENNRLTVNILKLCSLYKEDYISHNPFSYYILKPLKGFKRLVLPGGYRYLQYTGGTKSLLQKLLKAGSTICYFLYIILGLVGMLLCFKKGIARSYLLLIVIIDLTLILTIVLYSEIQEPRYFVHVFALLVPFAAFVIDKIMPKGSTINT